MKLLIVDDEAICRNGMAEVVAKRRPEVEVLTACNGIEAASILENEPVDGMFLDIRMPKCDGFELMKTLRQRGQTDIVTVIVSGLDDFEYARTAIKDNVFEYLLKPITPRETIDMVDRMVEEIGRRRSRRGELAALRDLVAKNRGEMLVQFFGDMVSGMYDRDELTRRGDLLAVDLHGEEFLVAAVKVLGRETDRSLERQQMDTVACRALLERFAADMPGAQLVQTSMDRFALLLTARKAGEIRPAAWIDGLERLIQRAREEQGLEMAAGVSEPCHAVEHIAVCYDEAMRTLQYKTLFAGKEAGFIRDYRQTGRGYYIADYDQVNVMIHNGELDKLIVYTDGKDITEQDIDEVCSKTPEMNMFKLLEAVGRRNTAEALDIYHNMLSAKGSPFGVLTMLVRQLKIMIECRYLAEKGMPAKQIADNLPEYKLFERSARGYVEQSKNFKRTALYKYLTQCYKCEENIKNGLVDDEMGVELLIIGMNDRM